MWGECVGVQGEVRGAVERNMGGVGGDVGKCVGVWGEVRKDVWGGCGRVYGVSGKCVGVWGKDVGRGMGEV